ncbi:hypothetical protein BGZ70_003183, partial [Mortierella alpina]
TYPLAKEGVCDALEKGCPVRATTADNETELKYCAEVPDVTGFTGTLQAVATHEDGRGIFCFKASITL